MSEMRKTFPFHHEKFHHVPGTLTKIHVAQCTLCPCLGRSCICHSKQDTTRLVDLQCYPFVLWLSDSRCLLGPLEATLPLLDLAFGVEV